MPIITLLLALDFKSGNLNLYALIGLLEVIKRYLLSCKATFHKENNKFSEIFSFKFSIIKASFVLNSKKILSFSASDSISNVDVLVFKIDARCVFPEPDGPNIFAILIRNEMDLSAKSEAEKEDTGSSIIPTDMQDLYDDVISYISDRGIFKASPMSGTEENPNEHIQNLCERLRSTRRYVMQEVINERALEKRKQLELDLKNQLASAEEIVMVAPKFTDGLSLFVQEKRYNFKYLSVEKVRMPLQLLGSITGAVYFLLGFMGYFGVHWVDGFVVCLVMLALVRILLSRKYLKLFYPTDISKELEDRSTAFINVMRNMSQEQMEHFMVRQIKLEHNQQYLTMVPEYVKYLYAIMPDRKSMMISVDELSELVENSEIEVAKQLRGQ